MSITKSYNKHTDTYYAYETTYVWDDSLQKKVQIKRCIGRFDPETGEVVPNGKRGRPGKPASPKAQPDASSPTREKQSTCLPPEIKQLAMRLKGIDDSLSGLSAELHNIYTELDKLTNGQISSGD